MFFNYLSGIWHSVEIESKSKLCRLNDSMTKWMLIEITFEKVRPFSRWCSSKHLIEKLVWSVCVVAAPSIRDYPLSDNRENIFKDTTSYQEKSDKKHFLLLGHFCQPNKTHPWIFHPAVYALQCEKCRSSTAIHYTTTTIKHTQSVSSIDGNSILLRAHHKRHGKSINDWM